MIDLASIRNASFTLTPTGYNPEEVDRFLADLADQLRGSADVHRAQLPPAAPAPRRLPRPRPEADVDGLPGAIERTIGAMDAFVPNELAAVRPPPSSRSRRSSRARAHARRGGNAARAHLEEAKARAEDVASQVRADAEDEAARIVAAAEGRRARPTRWWPRPARPGPGARVARVRSRDARQLVGRRRKRRCPPDRVERRRAAGADRRA